MNDSPTPAPPRKASLPVWLIVTAILSFAIFSLSLAGLTFWLLMQRRAPASIAAGNNPREILAPSAPRRDSPPSLATAAASAAPATSDFAELFNGQDLLDWNYNPAAWTVRDGVIRGHAGPNPTALFWAGGEVRDFELHFQFRLIRGNSGLYYRAQALEKFDVGGYEFEIYTNRIGNLADNGSDRPRRRLHYADFDKAPRTDTEWHEGIVIANGGRFIHKLDGDELCNVEDKDARAPQSGQLAFHMANATTVEFKEIRLKRLNGH